MSSTRALVFSTVVGGGFMPGPDPQRRSYETDASFSDPDGNEWLLQEVANRPQGRLWEE